MPTANSPYAAFAALLTSNGHPVSPAELHGLLLGRSCAGAGFEQSSWLQDAAELLDSEPQEQVRQALAEAFEALKKYEIVAQNIQTAEDREMARQETAMLDEMGLRLTRGGRDYSSEA